MTPSITDYPYAFFKSQEILNMLTTTRFPLDLKAVCDELGIILQTKQDYINYRIATNSTNIQIQINDGRSYLTYHNGRKVYLIIYDEKPYWRWRFTIAHELGHIILGHLNDDRLQISRGGIDSKLYKELENQADVFAGNFLAPPILIKEKLSQYNFPYVNSTISNTFHISMKAVELFRYPDYQAWLSINKPTEAEIALLSRCKNEMHFAICSVCKAETYYNRAIYCAICSSKKLVDLNME